MQVGSLVELVDDNWHQWYWKSNNLKVPIKSIIYTVRASLLRGKTKCLLLEEIENICNDSGEEYTFGLYRFRELQPPMTISIDEIVKEGAPA